MAIFTGTTGDDVADATNGTLTGFTGGTQAELQDGIGDSIDGLEGNDTIVAGSGDDTLTGGPGADAVSGGIGNDVLVVASGHATNGEVYDGGAGFDTLNVLSNTAAIHSFQSSTVTSIEAIAFGGVFSAFAAFNADQLGAGLSPNLAVTGSPLIEHFNSHDAIFVQLQTPGSIDVSGWTFTNWSLGNVADSISLRGSSGADTITGSVQGDLIDGLGGNDTLNGGLGNDTLSGGAGNDTMRGGLGNDIHIVDSTGDVVVESTNQGTDTVLSVISYTLGTNFENLTLLTNNVVALNGTGNSVANTITGNNSNNVLSGVGGNDTLIGSGGNDRLVGGTGNDSMEGGFGDDTYDVDSAGDTVTEIGGGHDIVRSTVSYTLVANVEDLFLLGTASNGTGNVLDNRLEGNSGANNLSGLEGNDLLSGGGGDDDLRGGLGNDRLVGGDGNDTLDGEAGNDLMQGGIGDDIYEVDASGDTIAEGANQGTELVRSSISFTLSNNVENLFLRGTDSINGTGNAENNALIGNSGTNVLNGLNGNDVLVGDAGNDTLHGGNGNDELNGGLGNDTLNGGAGNDFFSYATAAEGGDTIQGFVPADDTIAISSAGFGGGLTPSEVLVAGSTFVADANPVATTTEGTFLYDTDAGDLSWDADGNGGNGAVLVAHFDTPVALAPDDFLIV